LVLWPKAMVLSDSRFSPCRKRFWNRFCETRKLQHTDISEKTLDFKGGRTFILDVGTRDAVPTKKEEVVPQNEAQPKQAHFPKLLCKTHS